MLKFYMKIAQILVKRLERRSLNREEFFLNIFRKHSPASTSKLPSQRFQLINFASKWPQTHGHPSLRVLKYGQNMPKSTTKIALSRDCRSFEISKLTFLVPHGCGCFLPNFRTFTYFCLELGFFKIILEFYLSIDQIFGHFLVELWTGKIFFWKLSRNIPAGASKP